MTTGDLGARLELKGDRSRCYRLDTILRFGRSSRCDVVVKSSLVSRRHAEIRALSGGRYCVWDCGSRNGTFVNDSRITGSLVLHTGDEIRVGDKTFVFVGPMVAEYTAQSAVGDSTVDVTDVGLDDHLAITLVSDIRGYTKLGAQHGKAFQTFVADWFRAVVALLERYDGVVDKIHGDGFLAYWWVRNNESLAGAVHSVLRTCDGLMVLRDRFAGRLAAELGETGFDVGVAVHMGDVLLGNLGTGSVHAFTAVGDAVNMTFRLEEQTKKQGRPVLVSHQVALEAPSEFVLVDLGEVTLRGSSVPLRIWSLEGYADRPVELELDDDVSATLEVSDPEVEASAVGAAGRGGGGQMR